LEKVTFTKHTIDYFDELVFSLFMAGYFSYEEIAQGYVDKIIHFIITDIHTFPHKKTPPKLKHLGSRYIFYNSTSRTTWYLFFEKKDNNYIITGILNNHCEEAKHIAPNP
tara:strand:- start:10970 stop:11299 length:330 start_codon:yes stop_codon:yes gene_type:complete